MRGLGSLHLPQVGQVGGVALNPQGVVGVVEALVVRFEKASASLRQYDPLNRQIRTLLFAITHNSVINHWKSGVTHPTTGA